MLLRARGTEIIALNRGNALFQQAILSFLHQPPHLFHVGQFHLGGKPIQQRFFDQAVELALRISAHQISIRRGIFPGNAHGV